MSKDKNKCLFLDRDGIINVDINKYIVSIEEVKFYPAIFEITRIAKQKGYKIAIITNQAGISKGIQTYEEVESVHLFIKAEFAKKGISIDGFYYCPHHPDFSKCLCRKPGSLNFEKAIAALSILPHRSIMIGDNPRDIIPAQKLGITTILIHPQKYPELQTIQFEKLEHALPLLEKIL